MLTAPFESSQTRAVEGVNSREEVADFTEWTADDAMSRPEESVTGYLSALDVIEGLSERELIVLRFLDELPTVEVEKRMGHFYASALLAAGEDVKAVSEYMGHADPALTLRVYAHLMPDSREHARRAIDTVFQRLSKEEHGPQTAQ